MRNKVFFGLAVLLLVTGAGITNGAVYGQAPGGGPGGGSGGASGGRPGSGPGDGPGGAAGEPGMRGRPTDTDLAVVVERDERVVSTTVAGRLRPALSVTHTSTANGFVTAVHVRVGDRVAANAPLYTIERDESMGSYAPVVVRARVPGVISELPVRLFNEVRAGETGAVIIDPERLLLETFLTDKDADRVAPGMAVEARTAENVSIPGTLLTRSPVPDQQTGLYRLQFEFAPVSSTRDAQGSPDTAGTLAGRFVTVDLPVVRLEGVFVPQDLLVRRYGQYYIWVVTAENTLRLQQLSLGTTVDDDILVTAGLRPGMRYLRSPTGREREGMTVPGLESGS